MKKPKYEYGPPKVDSFNPMMIESLIFSWNGEQSDTSFGFALYREMRRTKYKNQMLKKKMRK